MLPPFISDHKSKHLTFISASYGDECYRHSVPTLKINTQHLYLASYGAECYRDSFPTLKTNTRHLFLASYGAEYYHHSFPTFKDKYPTFILASYGAECYRHSFQTLKTNTDIYFSVIRRRMLPPFISTLKTNTRHLF